MDKEKKENEKSFNEVKAHNKYMDFNLNIKDKKTLFFLGGVLIVALSINYIDQYQVPAIIGILLGAFFIIRALD